MKKRASAPKIASHLFLALVIYLVISLTPAAHPWVKVTLFLIWGTYFFIDFLKLMLIGTRYSLAGAYVLFYLGCLWLALFVVWLGNFLVKTAANYLSDLLAWQLEIGNLFAGIYQYVFSVPGLIIGAVLIITGALWENDAQLHEWHDTLFPKSRKRMFRREF